MTDEPYEFLTLAEKRAFTRMKKRLIAAGVWVPGLDGMTANLAARGIGRYLSMVALPDAERRRLGKEIEEARLMARQLAGMMLWFPTPGREHVALLNGAGVDVDLVALAAELPGD